MSTFVSIPWWDLAVRPALGTPAAGQQSPCPWTTVYLRAGQGHELADGQMLSCTVPLTRASLVTGNSPVKEKNMLIVY